jgi:phosphatidylglycerol:prolipoprotein diacylglycerol transferase
VSIAVISFDFDPVLRLGDAVAVRWQTVALVAALVAALVLAGLIARRQGLRPDDLLFIAVAAVPGALVGGRIGYVLLHLDYYRSNTTAIVDVGQGSLELALGLLGGVASSAYVAGLLGAPIGGWLRASALPLLFAIGASKLAMVLGGAGQGRPSDQPWATAYLGVGPWGSLAADLPAHPSQAYEGLAALAVLAALTIALAAGAMRGRDARPFLAGIGLWALARAVVSTTWRDPAVLGGGDGSGINAATLIAVALAIVCAAGFVVVGRRAAHPPATAVIEPDVRWADPETRPRF